MSAGAGVDEIEIMKAVFLSSTELMHRSLGRSCECARVYNMRVHVSLCTFLCALAFVLPKPFFSPLCTLSVGNYFEQ